MTKQIAAPDTGTDAGATQPATTQSPERGRGLWRLAAVAEVAAAVAAVVADWLIPSVVLVAMAVVSLLARRRGPSSLGFHRPAHPVRLVGQMAVFALAWTLFNIALLIPVTNHLSGARQDVSGFADLQGNLGLHAVYLTASGAIEQGVVGVIAAALAGVVFGVLRYRCRTLWAPVLAHGFDDTLGFIWFFFGPFYGLW